VLDVLPEGLHVIYSEGGGRGGGCGANGGCGSGGGGDAEVT